MVSGQRCTVFCEPGLRPVGYYTCLDGRILGASICVQDSFESIPQDVEKIAATLSVGIPEDTRFSEPVDVVLSRGLSSALNVAQREFSYFSSSPSNNGRRLGEEAACNDTGIVHQVSYEVVAPSLRKQEAFQLSQNVTVAGTEAYSRLSSVLTEMSGSGRVWPCTKEVLAPVLFTDQIVRTENGSIVVFPQIPSTLEEVAAQSVVDDGGLESWLVALLAVGGVCLCCVCSVIQTLLVLDCIKKRHQGDQEDVWHVPSINSSFRSPSTTKQVPRSPRQPETPRGDAAQPLPVLMGHLRSTSDGSKGDAKVQEVPVFKFNMMPSSAITWKRATPDTICYNEGNNSDQV